MNKVAQQPVMAFLVALAAVGVLSAMDAIMKALVIAIGIYATSVWRAIIGLFIATAYYLPNRQGWPSRSTMKIHLIRGVVITAMGLLFFWGLGRTPMAQAIALTFIAPLLSLFLAAIFLKEQIGPRTIIGSVAAFGGVILILAGQARMNLGPDALLGSLAILGSAVCYAVNIVLMRAQSMKAKPPEIAFFQNGTIAILMIASLPFFGGVALPTGHWLALLAAAFMSFVGLVLFAWAYARGQASYLSVSEYSGFVWAALFGWLVFGEHVSPFTLAGAVLIVGGCIFAARTRKIEHPTLESVG
nr:DMT family transporter [uncultured Sphingomonas sp.]